jgi:DNA-binding transcriptional regulator PaaX
VIFDIKEPHRATRDSLRRGLQAAGFEKLQDSVWVHPYPCEEFVALLKADMRVGKDVLYIVAEEIENEGALRRTFGLADR